MTQMTNMGSVPTFDLADRLAKALQHAGVSVQEMADELGVSRNTVGNYLNRRTKISRSALRVWSLRTGVPFGWLENGETPAGPGGPDGGHIVEYAIRDSNPEPAD